MNYVILPRTDWGKLIPIFKEHGSVLPELGIISAAMDGGKVGGFMCLQPVLHTEPIWIDPDYRGDVSFLNLHRKIASYMPQGVPYFAFAPDRKIARMAELCGLEEKNYRVWQGVF